MTIRWLSTIHRVFRMSVAQVIVGWLWCHNSDLPPPQRLNISNQTQWFLSNSVYNSSSLILLRLLFLKIILLGQT